MMAISYSASGGLQKMMGDEGLGRVMKGDEGDGQRRLNPSSPPEEKLKVAIRILKSFQRVVVAFSGGVDSTLLAKIAREVLGKDEAVAVTADSPSLAREELEAARLLAQRLDLAHLVIPTTELSDSAYRANSPARCYVCKQELFKELETLAAERQIPVILYGAIGDDLLAERPGQRAAVERGVRAPLQEAGLEKWEVRELARELGLPNWDRPQNACLSSRIPHGLEVTERKLAQIERAESYLKRHGFRQVRVRHLGTRARIEVEPEAVSRFDDATLRSETEQRFHQLGFESVAIDPDGYRPGGADRRPEDELSGKSKVESRK